MAESAFVRILNQIARIKAERNEMPRYVATSQQLFDELRVEIKDLANHVDKDSWVEIVLSDGTVEVFPQQQTKLT